MNTKKSIEATREATGRNIVIQQNNTFAVCLEVTGTAALIQNNFGQKAIEQMLKKHMGITVIRETKKPRECLEAATIRNKAGLVCVPPTAFKKGMLTASSALKKGGGSAFAKTNLRTSLFVEGQSVPITYSTCEPRMDMVRLAGMTRTPDVRFRPQFNDWKARLSILYSDTLSVQSVVDLLNRAGQVGVGEWRPEKDGTFGTYRVTRIIDTEKEISEVKELCSVALIPIIIPDWALDADIDPIVLAKIVGEQDQEEEGSKAAE